MNINIEKLKDIALDAGAAIMNIYQSLDQEIVTDKKSDDSPLTQADTAANQIICESLEGLYPDIPIISEENKQMDYAERKDWEYAWLVDPLDGTKEFIKHNGEFTVNIALLHGSKAIMGVVFAPDLDELYWAEKGKGALIHVNGKTSQLKAPTFKRSDSKLKFVASRSHLNEETRAFMDNYNDPQIVSVGSSLKFLMIAKGLAHIYPRIAPTMEWDTGAAQAILEEAGGCVVTYEDQSQDLIYNKQNLLNPYFIAMGNQCKSS